MTWLIVGAVVLVVFWVWATRRMRNDRWRRHSNARVLAEYKRIAKRDPGRITERSE